MKKKDRTFSVLLDEDDYLRLECLGERLSVSKGAVIRDLIRHGSRMVIQEHPTCATGQLCFMPQMHPRASNHALAYGSSEHPPAVGGT